MKSSPKILIFVPDPRLASAARGDLRDIRNYSKAAFGAAMTLDYIEGLRAILRHVGEMPLIGRAEDDLFSGLRSFPYKSHRIYYVRSEGFVLIVRILHHAQDARSVRLGLQ